MTTELESDRIDRADAERIDAWLARMVNVVDPSLRVASIRKDVSDLEPVSFARIVEELALAADSGVGGFAALLLFVSVASAAPELEAVRVAAGRIAIERGLFAAAELLLPESVQTNDAPGAIVSVSGRSLTHGERKSLARSRSRTWLDKLARDPSPDVIRILLANPALTETDVVRLASRRPIEPRILREIFLATRFVVRPLVRLSLVKNPALESHLAFALVRQLTRAEAHDVALSTDLGATVRDAARRASTRPLLH